MIGKRNSSIDIIRIFACILIVWNHLSNHILNGIGNPLSIANIGVQIFFFMSGFLYSGSAIDNNAWIKRNVLKIYKPYLIYLIFILPIIFLLSPSSINIVNLLFTFFALQGFSETLVIYGIGQLWFISYILICYILTPLIIKLNQWILNISASYETNGHGGLAYWLLLIVIMVICQFATVPLAFLFSFKVAYIFAYIVGYFYGARYKNTNNMEEKNKFDFYLLTFAIIFLFVRVFTCYYDWFPDVLVKLVTQWGKIPLAATIFVSLLKLLPRISLFKEKVFFMQCSSITYEVYLVHEFFTCDIFTRHLPSLSLVGEIVFVLLCVIVSSIILKKLTTLF